MPRDHRDLPRRGQAQQAHPGPHQVPGRRVGGGAAARRGRAKARPRAARHRSRRPTRSTPTATTWASTRRSQPGLLLRWAATTLRGRFTADQMIGVADIADRFGSGDAALHQPPERDRAGRARRRRRGGRGVAGRHRPADRRRRPSGAAIISCTGIQFCKLAIVETKDRAAELIEPPGAAGGRPRGLAADQPERLPQRLRPVPDRRHRPAGRDRPAGGRLAACRASSSTSAAGWARTPASAGGCPPRRMPADEVKYAVERIVRAYAAERPADGDLRRLGRASSPTPGWRPWRASRSPDAPAEVAA